MTLVHIDAYHLLEGLSSDARCQLCTWKTYGSPHVVAEEAMHHVQNEHNFVEAEA